MQSVPTHCSSVMSVQITSKLNHLGGTLDPHCAFLLQRSIKTLGVRVRQQNANALALATFLEQQPQVRGFRAQCQGWGRLNPGTRQRTLNSSRR